MASDWTSLLGGGLNLLAANEMGNQAVQSANTAAQMSQFRPVGVTTRFGKSGFEYGPQGQLTGAGYQVAPDIAAMREGLLGVAGGGLQQAQQAQTFQPTISQAGADLFGLGRQYIAQSPQAAAQNWMAQQQQLLAPGREQQLAQATNKEFQRGTMGLATGATQAGYGAGTPGLLASNPRMAALYNAQAMQDAQLAAQAQQAGMEQARFGQGLLTGGMDVIRGGYGLQTAALNPFTTAFQGATNIEQQAMAPLEQGRALGSAAAASQQAAAQQYMRGQQAQQAAMQGAVAGLSDPISRLIGGLAGGGSGTTFTPTPGALAFGSSWWE